MKPVMPFSPQVPRESLRGSTGTSLEQEKARLKKATQEFEAYFRYQMLKAMRKTVPESELTEGSALGAQGKETFRDMMDMELSKSGSGGSGSIADILFRSTVKLLEARYATKGPGESTVKPIELQTSGEVAIPLRKEPVKLDKAEPAAVPLQKKPAIAPLRPHVKTAHESIMAKYGDLIDAAAKETKLDSTLIASVIHAESSGNPAAVSPAGAKGLMQLVDTTAEDLGVTDAFDPGQNIMGGSRFLKKLVDRYQDIKLALAAYNAGPGNVDKYGGLPPFKETRAYVSKVMGMVEQSAKSPKVR